MGLTLRPIEARPNRKAENGSGVIGKGQRVPEKFGFLSIFGRQKSLQNSLSDNVLFDTAPVSQYV